MREIAAVLPKTSTLERMGVKYFQGRAQRFPAYECEDAVHILNEREQEQLLRIERLAMSRAFMAGALSGLVTFLASWAAWPMLGPYPALAGGEQFLRFSALVWTATGIATVFEFWFLYWDALRSVHRLSHAAGVCLFDSPNRDEEAGMASALARAALELPTPPLIFSLG